MIAIGQKAVPFTLPDSSGNPVSLESFLGKNVVVYFYPKDNTPGCTAEACAFRDVYDIILSMGAAVIGVSPDSSESHAKFRQRHNLPFFLLSDADHAVAEAYGAWGEKHNYGKTYMGIIRSTFIVDKAGSIAAVFPKVSPEKHADEVLNALERLK